MDQELIMPESAARGHYQFLVHIFFKIMEQLSTLAREHREVSAVHHDIAIIHLKELFHKIWTNYEKIRNYEKYGPVQFFNNA